MGNTVLSHSICTYKEVLIKICKICKQQKSLDCFHNNSKNTDCKDSRCKDCRKIAARKNYTSNYFVSYIRFKKSWCKSRNVDFNLDAEYLENIWTGKCPIFGTDITFGGIRDQKGSHNSAHLDRLSPSVGYIKGNVAWISGRANRIKYDATSEELRKIANRMESVTTSRET